MSGKSLSTGTLSLRFMQNAYRAKQLAQVEAEQAHVKDEAEWEVSKEVKEAWGMGTGSNEAEESIGYEPSYMPFLYERNASDDVPKPKGRRIFNKAGREPLDEAKQEVADKPPQTQENVDFLVHRLRKEPVHPGSISAYSSAVHSSAIEEIPLDVKMKKPLKTTAQKIRDNDGASTDLVQATSIKQPATRDKSLGTAFLKPSGVDGPTNSVKASVVMPQNDDIIITARSQVKVTMKRERESAPDHSDRERKKRKKKKKKTTE